MQRRFVARLALLLPAALAAVLMTPGTAHAWQVTVQVSGAGIIDETTPANKMYCSTPYSSSTTNCVAGTPTGDYAHGWLVTYTATAKPGYSFAHWAHPTGGAVICEGATGATYTSSTCTFRTFDNLSLKAVFVDTAAPNTPVLDSAPPSATNARSATFQLRAWDDPTVKEHSWRLDGGAWTATSNHNVSLSSLADGGHTFEIKAVDYAGNESGTRTHSWTVDTAAPSVTMDSPTDGAATKAADVTISGTTAGGATQVLVYDNNALIGTVWPSVGGAWSFKHIGPVQGTHTYKASARDAAGNFSHSAPATVSVDRDAPRLDVLSPTDDSYDTDGTVVVSGTAEPGSTVRVARTGTELGTVVTGENGLWSRSLEGLQQGAHSLDVTATDRAGNVSPAQTRTVTVDTIVPIATALKPANGAAKVSRRTNVTAAFSEQVDSTTVKSSNVYLVRKGTTKKIPASVVYDAVGTRVTIDPKDRLRKKTVYVVTVSRGVRDLAGHNLLTKLRWSFKTAG